MSRECIIVMNYVRARVYMAKQKIGSTRDTRRT